MKLIVESPKLSKKLIITGSIAATVVLLFSATPSLRLVGVHNNSIAIIEDQNEGVQEVFELNGNVFGSGKIVEITDDQVRISKNGSEFTISRKTGISTAADELLARIVENRQVDFLPQYHALPQEVLSSLPAPVVRNEQVIGFSLARIDKDSIFGKAGMQSGDIVKSINGKAVESVFHALEIVKQSNPNDLSVEIERDNAEMSLRLS